MSIHFSFYQGYTVNSLNSICLDYIAKNLRNIHLESLQYLSITHKEKILKKILLHTTFTHKLNFNNVLSYLVHRNLNAINLNSCIDFVNDETLTNLKRCEFLKELRLKNGVSFSTEALQRLLMNLKHLKVFIASNCSAINDDFIKSIKDESELEYLDLSKCNISNNAIEHISNVCNNLKYLSVAQTKITANGLEYFVNNSKSTCEIEELRIDSCREVTNDFLMLITEKCPHLNTLSFNNCAADGEFEGIEKLAKNMRQLNWTLF